MRLRWTLGAVARAAIRAGESWYRQLGMFSQLCGFRQGGYRAVTSHIASWSERRAEHMQKAVCIAKVIEGCSGALEYTFDADVGGKQAIMVSSIFSGPGRFPRHSERALGRCRSA